MIRIRRSAERGHFDHGWLDTRHTFSFAEYHDPSFMGFRSLRVINEDRVEAGRGFGTHPHRDMEILTFVLDGELAHKDSMGNGSIIRPGEVQRMSAGTGVAHSEANPSQFNPVHLLQIWILPESTGLAPSYEQKGFPDAQRRDRLCLLASRDARQGSVTIHQDVNLYASVLSEGRAVEHALAPGRAAWLQVAAGEVEVGGHKLVAGDGAAVEGERSIRIRADDESEVLLFDLA